MRDGGGTLHGIVDADLSAAVRSLPSQPDIEADDEGCFHREVKAIAEHRAHGDWSGESEADVAAFILARYPREVGSRLSGTPVIDVMASQMPILGNLFFMNRDASRGFVVPLPVSPTHVLDWLEEQGLGSSIIILVYRASKTIVARNGVSSRARHDQIRRAVPEASLAELEAALKFFHLHNVLTPTVCPVGLWEPGRASQYVPGAQPEKSIERDLRIALSSWFRGVVRAEPQDTIPIGRIDVRLLIPDGGRLAYWAIIELKIIKSFRNALQPSQPTAVALGENVEELCEGFRQANAFSANRHADYGLLEVYDLRRIKDDNVFKHGDIVAAIHNCAANIIWNVRDIYGSSADAREAGYDVA